MAIRAIPAKGLSHSHENVHQFNQIAIIHIIAIKTEEKHNEILFWNNLIIEITLQAGGVPDSWTLHSLKKN